MKKSKKFLAVLLTAAVFFTAGGCGDGKQEEDTGSAASQSSGFDMNSDEVQRKTEIIQSLIEKNAFNENDKEKQEKYYYNSLLAGLNDRYAVYYTAEEYARVQEDDGGEYVGIGATVSKNMENGAIYVVQPIKGSPAEEVGLQPDDIFIEIDGTELTTDMELEEVVKIIRGSSGSTAHLKMYRAGEDDYLEFEVPRRKIQNVTVEYDMLENGYGYIKISEFIETTNDQFCAAVDDLVSQGAKGLIFDVRNNPGGLTDIVIRMVDYLVEDDTVPKDGDSTKPGVLLEMKDKNGTILYQDYTKDGHSVDLPMAVLMNGNSASSSEIFAGCLRDYGKVTLVGETSYGKGIVQQTFPFSDGSAVKMTIAKYYLPSGSNIHETGIEPDVESVLSTEKKKILYKLPYNEDTVIADAIKTLGGTPLPAPATPESSSETGSTETSSAGGTTESTETVTTESTETVTTESTEEATSESTEDVTTEPTEEATTESTEED